MNDAWNKNLATLIGKAAGCDVEDWSWNVARIRYLRAADAVLAAGYRLAADVERETQAEILSLRNFAVQAAERTDAALAERDDWEAARDYVAEQEQHYHELANTEAHYRRVAEAERDAALAQVAERDAEIARLREALRCARVECGAFLMGDANIATISRLLDTALAQPAAEESAVITTPAPEDPPPMTDGTLLSRVRAALDILREFTPGDESYTGPFDEDVFSAISSLEAAKMRLEDAEEAEAEPVATPIEPVDDDEPLSAEGWGMDDAEVERIARLRRAEWLKHALHELGWRPPKPQTNDGWRIAEALERETGR